MLGLTGVEVGEGESAEQRGVRIEENRSGNVVGIHSLFLFWDVNTFWYSSNLWQNPLHTPVPFMNEFSRNYSKTGLNIMLESNCTDKESSPGMVKIYNLNCFHGRGNWDHENPIPPGVYQNLGWAMVWNVTKYFLDPKEELTSRWQKCTKCSHSLYN